MAKVTLKAAGSVVRLFLDGKKLPSDDTVSANVADGEHSVQWFVRGDPGDKFSVAVVAPPSAAKEVKGTFDESGHDAGTFWILV